MARKPLFRSWTADEIAVLETLLREGKTYRQIARRLKRSEAAVGHQARRLAESERLLGNLGVKPKR
jgi:DNA-binding NarL/FixJ family response regulator